MDRPRESPARSLLVAVAVCSVCSLVVSTAAVLLRPLQLAHLERERKGHILAILNDLPGIFELVEEVDLRFLEERVVELESGRFDDAIDPQAFDARAAAMDPTQSVEIPSDLDLADLGQRARHATVYCVRQNGEIRLLILPVHGTGFVSTLYGYLALDGDTNTILGLAFYEQAETPGLGAQITDPAWLSKWPGKKVRDAAGRLRVAVAAREVAPGDPAAAYEVDGITGATYTGDGVTAMLQYWLGEHGFGPLLQRVREGGAE